MGPAETDRSGIAAAAVRGVRWNYVGSLFSVVCSLTVTAVLARVLGPRPFGEALIASTIYGFANLFVNGGFSQALVQQKELPELQIRRVFTMQMLLGLLLSTATVYLAPLIARAFHVASASPVIRATASIITFQAFGVTSSALLRREMRFEVIQQANIVSYVLGYAVIGLPLALRGAGVWSLVAAYLSQALASALYVYVFARHSIKPSFHLPSRELMKFTGAVTGSNLVNWGHSNLDNLASSRLGPASLGLYGRVCNLAYQPVTAAVTALQPVLLTAAAKLQGRPETARKLLLSSIAVLTGLTLPSYLCLAVLPYTTIVGLYGPKWSGAVALIIPFALAMPLWGAMALCGPVLTGIGKPHLEFWAQASSCAIAAAAFFAASRISLVAIAWMLLGVSAIRLTLLAGIICHALQIPYSSAAASFTGRFKMALPFALFMYTCDLLLQQWTSIAGLRLTADASIAGLLIGTLICFFPGLVFGAYTVEFLHGYAHHLPTWLQASLRRSIPSANLLSLEPQTTHDTN